MKAYKGFNKDMTCRGFRFEEGKTYEEQEAVLCKKGFHACENPLDVFKYYSPAELCEYHEVELEGTQKAPDGDDSKVCGKKITIGAKLGVKGLVEAFVQKITENTNKNNVKDDGANIGSTGEGANIGSTGAGARIGSTGDEARISCSGDEARIGSTGAWARISCSGDWARIGSTGDGANIGSTGAWANIGSTGAWARIGSTGAGANIGSTGAGARIGSTGDEARIGSTGEGANIGSTGAGARISCSGYGAQIGSSGDWAKIEAQGKNSVIMCAGNGCIVKTAQGDWITLAEWKAVDGEYTPVCVKTVRVDGETIKADTWYTLRDGEFAEVDNAE